MTDKLSAFGGNYSNIRMVTIGSKGREYFAHHGVKILMEHDAPADTMTFEKTKEISGPLMELYTKGEIDEIDIVYTSYINTLKQEVRVKKLLPIDIASKGHEGSYTNPIEYGPSADTVFSYLIPKYIELMIFSTCIESATCEYAARRMAMENANDNAKDMLKDLQLEYNHARQTEITDEIIEIVAGSEAQK